ncbi:MAG TPA: XRE family transcriptional regulator [Lachnospiraceae bacterium]|nr:XRE family transcriptional regulator [Lachnospiraceae bacterium]
MNTKEMIELSLIHAKMTKTDIGNHFGVTQPTISDRIKISKFTKEQLQEIAHVMGAEYHSYFEFPDGTKFGD